MIANSVQHGAEAAGSDASQSSREHTDASSVDSLDIASTEKPKYKKRHHQSLKDTVFAIYHKRKSTPNTAAAAADKSPDSPRRSSAPHTRTATNKLHLPVSECQPPASRSPVREKRLLHACKSDGEAISPMEEESLETGGFDVVDGRSRDAPQTAPVLLHKADSVKLIAKMSRKIRSCIRFASKSPSRRRGDARVPIVDLSSDDVPVTPSVLVLTYSELLQLGRSS